jgi:hypothetical protein
MTAPTMTAQRAAETYSLRSRLQEYEAWLKDQIGAFPNGHSGDTLAARAAAHLRALFPEIR